MSKVLRWWFTRGVFGLQRTAHDADDEYASFERVDGALLGRGDFRLSASMRLDARPDFCETLPACNYGAVSGRAMGFSQRAA
ncbi:MAG: hypothetical protein ACHP83_09485 [Burkholderiales bacterium]